MSTNSFQRNMTLAGTLLRSVYIVVFLLSTLHAEELRVLVTNDGQTFYGRIEPTDLGYRIEVGERQQMFLPSQTRCVAPSLEAAYATMFQDMEQAALANNLALTADSHYQLARWCYDYGLYNACQLQLALALQQDQHHEASIKLARRFKPSQESKEAGETSSLSGSLKGTKTVREMQEKILVATFESEVTPLGSLPKEIATSFQKMQPVIASHCGKGGCHDPTTHREFVFLHLPRDGGMYRNRLEQNLSELADAMRRTGSVEQFNRLISGNNRVHAQPIFVGQFGAERLAAMQGWTRAYGEFAGLNATGPEVVAEVQLVAPVLKDSSVQQAGFETEQTGRQIEVDAILEKARKDHQIDAFNPDVFNQMHR